MIFHFLSIILNEFQFYTTSPITAKPRSERGRMYISFFELEECLKGDYHTIDHQILLQVLLATTNTWSSHTINKDLSFIFSGHKYKYLFCLYSRAELSTSNNTVMKDRWKTKYSATHFNKFIFCQVFYNQLFLYSSTNDSCLQNKGKYIFFKSL